MKASTDSHQGRIQNVWLGGELRRLEPSRRRGRACVTLVSGLSHLSASATPAQLTTLTLLIKASATVRDYRGHLRTLFPARDLSPCSSYAKNDRTVLR